MTETLVSPFLTTQEVADFARCNYETVRRAAVEWQRSGGKTGLKTHQRKANTEHRFLMPEVLEWLDVEEEEKPKRRVGRGRSLSSRAA